MSASVSQAILLFRLSISCSMIVRSQAHCPRGTFVWAFQTYFLITQPGSSTVTLMDQQRRHPCNNRGSYWKTVKFSVSDRTLVRSGSQNGGWGGRSGEGDLCTGGCARSARHQQNSARCRAPTQQRKAQSVLSVALIKGQQLENSVFRIRVIMARIWILGSVSSTTTKNNVFSQFL